MASRLQLIFSCVVALGLSFSDQYSIQTENPIKIHDKNSNSVPSRNQPQKCHATANDPDADCIPGIGGIDYPNMSQVPLHTDFDCTSLNFPGLYADPHYGCQVFHICNYNDRRKFSFLCPNGTILDQRVFVCVSWLGDFNCADAPMYYHLNENFYGTSVSSPNLFGSRSEADATVATKFQLAIEPEVDLYARPTYQTPQSVAQPTTMLQYSNAPTPQSPPESLSRLYPLNYQSESVSSNSKPSGNSYKYSRPTPIQPPSRPTYPLPIYKPLLTPRPNSHSVSAPTESPVYTNGFKPFAFTTSSHARDPVSPSRINPFFSIFN
ncbi:hypothetical protein CHUAL_008520 [Chamberlinius hualienensis]